MNMALYSRNFSGTGIKTPFDQMRANAMINARHDTRGMSILIFNVNYFLQEARHQDLYYVLSTWAIEPMRRSPAKFKRYPEAGKKALYKRVDICKRNFYMARHIHDCFVDKIVEHMMIAIDNELSLICPDIKHSDMRCA
ncbi:MAG: hypothetical protein KAJ40_02640 [Alphaproteobacteria bacterium]|nr:hypothetical protein [Alphaproteobacteria bacterium]